MRGLLLLLASATLLTSATLTLAQGGGQFCLRAFEDRNGNGSLEPGEPLLTAGVSAELRDAAGLVVASGLLDSSPMAAQGVICFQFLQPGEYTLVVSSAARAATGDTSFTQRIDEGALPILVDYGARQLPAAAPSAPARATTDLAQFSAQSWPVAAGRAAGDGWHARHGRAHLVLRVAPARAEARDPGQTAGGAPS